MVRIKERYLLVNILYPPDSSRPAPANVPDYVAVHRPTVEHVNAQALSRGIKTAVSTLFGDYGSGATESNLSGMPHSLSFRPCQQLIRSHSTQPTLTLAPETHENNRSQAQ